MLQSVNEGEPEFNLGGQGGAGTAVAEAGAITPGQWYRLPSGRIVQVDGHDPRPGVGGVPRTRYLYCRYVLAGAAGAARRVAAASDRDHRLTLREDWLLRHAQACA